MRRNINALLVSTLFFITGSAFAGPISPIDVLVTPTLTGTNCAAVTLTNVNQGGGNLLQQSYNSSQCIGFVPNAYQYQEGIYQYADNIGAFGDGLLNGESDLQQVGEKNDKYWANIQYFNGTEFTGLPGDPYAGWVNGNPGWIGLVRQNLGEANPTYNTVPYNNSQFSLDTILNFSFNSTDGKSGTWRLDIDPAAIQIAMDVLGKAYFDHLAILLKAGTDFVVYDFNFNSIFGSHNSQYGTDLSLLSAYNLGGTWNTSNLGDKGLSHIVLAAHDPELAADVSAPSSLALLGLTLLGFAVSRRRNV